MKPAPRRDGWLLLAAVFLLVTGARLWLVERYGVALPFWDQWNAEGERLLKPWLEGRLHFADLFAPHNEHRIFFTRAIALGLFVINGQWDALVEMAFNAVLGGGLAAAATALFWEALAGRWRVAIALAVMLLFVLPFSWENTLCGFQNQFYLLLLFSLATLWGLGGHAPWSCRWALGAGCAAAACLTMATGFTAAGIVLLVDLARRRAGRWVTRGFCAVIVLLGLASRTTVPGHEALKAASAGEWIAALGKALAWPFCAAPWLALWMWLPLALLAARHWWPGGTRSVGSGNFNGDSRRRPDGAGPSPGCPQFIWSLALWVGLQAAAMAYARGAGGQPPASRYMDLLALGAALNFIAALLLLERRQAGVGPVTIWVALLALGLGLLTRQNFAVDLPARAQDGRTQERNVRGYVATGDTPRYLEGKPRLDIPFPNPAALAAFLDDPTLRQILPATVRPPLTITRIDDAALDPGFVPGGYDPVTGAPTNPAMTWGSFNALASGGQGQFLGSLRKPSTLPYLRFEFAGHLGQGGMSFVLRDRVTDRRLDFHPAHIAPTHWRADDLVASGHDFEIIALDRTPERWFAFSGAVEVGRLSHWAGFALRRGGLLFGLGLVLLIGPAVHRWLKSIPEAP